MNFSAMTVSYPIDQETFNEIKQLCEAAEQADLKVYDSVMNLSMAKSYQAKGFFVLIYDDAKDALAGAASAVDLMGLNTYECSLLVDPMYRKLGIGEALYEVLMEGLEARGSEGHLALAVEGSYYGEEFLKAKGYRYSFSECTLEAQASVLAEPLSIALRPYESKDEQALCAIFARAFGDTEEESLELISFNSTTEGLRLWVAEYDGEIVGTITTRKEGDSQWITAVAVGEQYQNQGIGSQLLAWAKDYCLRSGESTVMLDVEMDNKKALSIYEKNGFLISAQLNYFVQII